MDLLIAARIVAIFNYWLATVGQGFRFTWPTKAISYELKTGTGAVTF